MKKPCPYALRARLWTCALFLALQVGTGEAWAGTSTAPNPSVTFQNPGIFNVTLEVCNRGGCSTLSRTLTILDPNPAITLARIDGEFEGTISVHAGELVRLQGNGTGKPPLDFYWKILTSQPVPDFPSLPGREGWWDTTGMPPGVYAAVLHLSNAFGAVESLALAITVLPEAALEFYTLTPCRIFDSRDGHGALVSGEAITISVDTCGIPANARALATNLTVVNPTATGKVNIYPGNYPVPPTAESSFAAGVTRANQVVVGVSTSGDRTVAARAEMTGGGMVHVILDVSGYFAPAVP